MNGKYKQAYAARMERVCDYITHHLDEELNLEQLSQVAHFSKFHFHRQFAEYTGITLNRYIQLMRLKRASYSLAFKHSDKIIDIAMEAQFENPESFSRAFKHAFGQTPSQFRHQPDWANWHLKFDFAQPTAEGVANMDIKIVDFPATRIAVYQHRGPIQYMNESIGRFIEWRKSSGLSPVYQKKTMAIAYDDPETTAPDKFRTDIGGEVDAPIPENPQGVVNSMIPAGRCAVLRHKGPHETIGKSVHAMFRQWLPDSGEELRDFPVFFDYLSLLPDTPEHELETDIYLPLK